MADNTIEKLKIISEKPKLPEEKKLEQSDAINGRVKNLIVLTEDLNVIIELNLYTNRVQYCSVDP